MHKLRDVFDDFQPLMIAAATTFPFKKGPSHYQRCCPACVLGIHPCILQLRGQLVDWDALQPLHAFHDW